MIAFTPASDPLGHTAPLDQCARFPLLGLPLEIQSNSPAVLAAAERSFGHWRALAAELVAPVAPLLVQVIVHPAAQALSCKAEFVQRVYGARFVAASGANLLTAQLDHGVALAFVTPELVADDQQFRYHVLECLALLLASWRDRTPVHAGAVVWDGRAVLLVGQSTAGKSTLCYACLRAGLQLLAEDVVYVGLRDGLRLWGNPDRIHLLPDARERFDELAEYGPHIQANGKHKLAIEVAALGPDARRHSVEQATVCLLERHAGWASALTPIAPQLAIDALSRNLEPGFDLHQRATEVAGALAQGGAYRLRVGRDLSGAVALIRRLASASREHGACRRE
jgi:hypothetical protein